MNASDLIATLGVSLLLLAYFLQVFKIISAQGTLYGLLNFIGAAVAGYASWRIGFIPFVVLELVWAAVALVGLMKLKFFKRST